MNYLLDTNVLSETIKPEPNSHVIAWLESIPQGRLYISALTIGEIRKGIESLAAGKKHRQLLHWLEVTLLPWFSGHIISIDSEVADKWGYLTAHAKRTLPAIDSLLAASALTHNLTLVTRNTGDFQGIPGLEILNPWES